MVGMIFEDETGFEERVASPLPSSDSSDDGYSANEQDGTVDGSKRKYRGKALLWEEFLDPVTNSHESFSTLQAVARNATENDFSKRGSSASNSRIFVCKSKGCKFVKKYRQFESTGSFFSYFNGSHSHTKDIDSEVAHRGLTGEQKLIVEEAFELGK